MALEGPQLVYTRKEDESSDVLTRALGLARELEALLQKSSSAPGRDVRGAHSTRIVQAMAASPVDELDALVRGPRKSEIS